MVYDIPGVNANLSGPTGFTPPRFDPRAPTTFLDPVALNYVVDDVTGDGRADLLVSFIDQPPSAYPFQTRIHGSVIRLHPGTVDGFAEIPLWEIDSPTIVTHALAIQADGDPELDLVVLAADQIVGYEYSGLKDAWNRFYIFDEVSSSAPMPRRLAPSVQEEVKNYKPMRFDDVDGDGHDDLLLRYDPVVLVLSSAAGYDLSQPWTTLDTHLDPGSGNGLYLPAVFAHDFDADGKLDVAVGTQYYDGQKYRYRLFVWFADAPEGPTDTSDTGASTATTGDTGSTLADTGAPTPAACGCAATSGGGSALWLGLVAWAVRRRSSTLELAADTFAR